MNNSFNLYIHQNSFWHKLNPSIKLIITIIFIALIFLPTGLFGQLIVFVIITLIFILSKVPLRYLKNILITWIVIFTFLFLINWIAYKGPGVTNNIFLHRNLIFGSLIPIRNSNHYHQIFPGDYGVIYGDIWGGSIIDFSSLKPTASDVKYVTFVVNHQTWYLIYRSTWYSLSSNVLINTTSVSLKIICMISIMMIISSATSSVELTNGIESLLHPLSYIKVPIKEWAMVISIVIRFVPSLLQESHNVLRAQAARGVGFKNGNIKDRVKALVSLIIPMFSIAFHKADDLSNAMEARNYMPRVERTMYRNYQLGWRDYLTLTIFLILLGMFIIYSIKTLIFAPFSWVEYLQRFGK